MAQGSSDVKDPNDVVTSQSLTEETTTTQRQRLTGTLPQLPTLPFDLLPEILCRLPVKLLLQLRCLCKFFDSLISDPKFAKKHLQLSTKCHHLTLISHNISRDELVQYDSPISLVFSTSTVVTQTQLYLPNTLTIRRNYVDVMCSCDGIFCCMFKAGSYFLWNPSIRKFKLLPPLENPRKGDPFSISFGYDHFIDNYKIIVVSYKNEVSVNTLGTDYWRRIEDIPYSDPICGHGVFVSDTVNWFVSDVIISLDLEKESYQNLSLPDFENENDSWTLGVVMDCLCVFARSDIYWDVWIMKEYGNKESWTKLYTIPNLQDQDLVAGTALYISEDDQLLVQCYVFEAGSYIKLVVYDSKTGTLNILEFQNNYEYTNAIVYIESLISP